MHVTEDAIRDGFLGQRMLTLPRAVIRRALAAPVTGRLLVTDAGFFPHAVHHGRSRPGGARENIVLICTDGAGWCRIGESRILVRQGDAVTIPEGVEHSYGASNDDPWSLWWLHLVGSDAKELVATAQAAAGGAVSHLRDPAPLASLVSQTIDALDMGTAGGMVRASGSAWNLMAQLIATGRRPQGAVANPVERAIEHLMATSPRRTSVGSLAAMVGLGTSQFTALFKEQVGVPPLRYQNNLRMARARELLDSTSLTVAEISVECGYPDPLYFSRQFSQVHQMSPTDYRTRHK